MGEVVPALGCERDLKFSGSILSGDCALRCADLFQHAVQRGRFGAGGLDLIGEAERSARLKGLDLVVQQGEQRPARRKEER